MFMNMFLSLSANVFVVVCPVIAPFDIKQLGRSSSINRKKYVFATDRIA